MARHEKERIKAIQRGDKGECQALVAQYLPSLYAFFQGMGLSPSVAEDTAQETFLELWKSLGRFRGDSSLKTWIFVIGRRVAWRQLQRHSREVLSGQATEMADEAEASAPTRDHLRQDELLWRREQKAQLEASILALDVRFREILLLHYMEDMSIREVAQVLDLAAGTVKSRLHRALLQLRTTLKAEWQ